LPYNGSFARHLVRFAHVVSALGLEFVQGGFGAVDEGFVVDDRGVEGGDEFEEIGLAFEEVGEEVGILGGQGAELVEERLLRLQLLAERAAWVSGLSGL
jgi:hypothetical protein